MNRNVYSELVPYLNKILSNYQKRSALGLLILMIIGMILEIFLLNNLLILLNYLTKSNIETPEIIIFIGKFFKTNEITILVLLLFIATLIKTPPLFWYDGKKVNLFFLLRLKFQSVCFLDI